MSQQQQPRLNPTYIQPITCICGGVAHLIRSAPHPMKLGGGIEILTFQCYECHRLTETTTHDFTAGAFLEADMKVGIAQKRSVTG